MVGSHHRAALVRVPTIDFEAARGISSRSVHREFLSGNFRCLRTLPTIPTRCWVNVRPLQEKRAGRFASLATWLRIARPPQTLLTLSARAAPLKPLIKLR